MKTPFTLLALLLFQSAGFLPAQEAPKAQTKHCLWKVQGQTNSVAIFGSIHFLKKGFYPLPKPIEDAYTQSQILVLETDLDEMEAPETQIKMLQAGKYPNGQTLKQNLSKETYDKLQSHLTA